jgi:hypothetical protein
MRCHVSHAIKSASSCARVLTSCSARREGVVIHCWSFGSHQNYESKSGKIVDTLSAFTTLNKSQKLQTEYIRVLLH